MEGHRQACPAKFISDYRDRLNRLFFSGQGEDIRVTYRVRISWKFLALNAILPSFPLRGQGSALDCRFVAFGHESNPLRQLDLLLR